MTSYDLFRRLYHLDLLEASDTLWWPHAGSFDVVVGAILTQQTQWPKVEASLDNLRRLQLLSPEAIIKSPQWIIAQAITPSGFYNTKAQRLIALCQAMINDFEDFDTFRESVTRSWLLHQKGIGAETADAILCYGCGRDEMVVDSYTARLLQALGVFDQDELFYETIKEWLCDGIHSHWDDLLSLYPYRPSHHQVYSQFHGMIVEFCKKYKSKDGCHIEVLERDI